MDNFIKTALNRNSLRALTKDFYIDELEKFSNNLSIIINQRIFFDVLSNFLSY